MEDERDMNDQGLILASKDGANCIKQAKGEDLDSRIELSLCIL